MAIFCRYFLLLTTVLLFAQLSLAVKPQYIVGNVPNTPSSFRLYVYGQVDNIATYDRALIRAFEAMKDIWRSSVPLDVYIKYQDLEASQEYAKSKPNFYLADPNKPQEQYLQVGAWEAIKGQDTKHQSQFDINIKINVNSRIKWHVSDDAPPPDTLDLSTVVMHEVYHNLIFSGNIAVRKQDGVKIAYVMKNGIPARFDKFLVNKQGCSILGYLTDKKLQKRLKKSGGELLKAAISNEDLYFQNSNQSFKLQLHAPKSYGTYDSVYHVAKTAGDAPTLMNPRVLFGTRMLNISQQLRELQNIYLDNSVPGARVCSFTLANPYHSLKSNRKIGGMPKWAFGLCMVLLVIVFVILLFGICTIGAVAKQKGKSSIWQRFTCCCTGVDDGKESPVFMYIDESTARRAQSARNSTEVTTAVMLADSMPHVPAPPHEIEVSTRETSTDYPSAASLMSQAGLESQLPPRFYM